MCVYIYTYMHREREKERVRVGEIARSQSRLSPSLSALLVAHAGLFRQARSCTSRVKTVPNAARSSRKTSFQLLPVFPTRLSLTASSLTNFFLLLLPLYFFTFVRLDFKYTGMNSVPLFRIFGEIVLPKRHAHVYFGHFFLFAA